MNSSKLPNCNLDALGESDVLDFKAKFDPRSKQEWCELIKDIVSMANSGGGCIVFGVNDDGTPAAANIEPILQIDPADITNKIHSYTDHNFSEFDLQGAVRNGQRVAVFRIAGVRLPIVFVSPGTYSTGPSSQRVAFSKGTVYFRHGPKSEPGTTDDLRLALERELEHVKEFWLQGISKVVAAPPGSTVQVVQHEVSLRNTPDATAIRLTTDSAVPVFRAIQADELYPYRQKELLQKLSEHLGAKVAGQHDLQSVRRVHGIDENPTFSHKAQWSPRQYSDAFVDWLLEQYSRNQDFFRHARESLRRPHD